MASNELSIIVTGAGSGFGALTVKALALNGHKVYAGLLESPEASSKYQELDHYAREHNVHVKGVQLDITDDGCIETAVETVMKREGKIDVVVHNAGACSLRDNGSIGVLTAIY